MSVVLSESVGYLVLLGVGLLMAAVVTILVKIETKWLGTRKTSEWFYTAGRTIKTGLIASSIVSAWTWAATLLQSSTVTFEFGIAGSFWYAAGASIQVILFSILAIELKRKAPMTHTFPEMLYVRYGKHSHKVFLFFALMTNTIVTAMLVLGGAAVVNSLTGVDIVVATFLLPIGILAYTLFGGLKATFFAEYINAGFIFVVVLVFVSVIYFQSPDIGGVSGMFEKLTTAAALSPVQGNAAGSFLTMASMGALVFGVINIVGNFGTVFVDQSYWQRAIAARPMSAASGFMIGGLAWFAIPFALATTLGLAAVAINVPLTQDQIGQGLVAPTAAVALMGDLGAILIISIVFTAVTAAGSSQLISVSSLVTYDIFRTYIKPSATGRQLIRVSRYAILIFGVGMGALASILFLFGVSLQYVYLMMGVLIGSAVVPISMSILWAKTSRYAATGGALAGLAGGISGWLASAMVIFGEITITSTGSTTPLLIGNVASITISLAITLGGSFLTPDRFDFRALKQRILVVDGKIRSLLEQDSDEQMLARASRFCKRAGLAITVILVVVWPAPLYLSGYILSEQSFIVWVWLAMMWAVGAASTVIILPAFEARSSMRQLFSQAATETYDANLESRNLDGQPIIKVLVPVDGSVRSLQALNGAHYLLRGSINIRVYLLHVIEWPDQDEQDDEMISVQMQQEGRMILGSVAVPREITSVRRFVKLGDPPTKIAEMADHLNIDLIAMGRRGLGNTKNPLGHVALNVIRLSPRPVALLD